MASTSTYSYIGFLCNENINADPSSDEFEPIPDHLRAMLNKYWNGGRFIGAGTSESKPTQFRSVSFVILEEAPSQRIEQIILKPLTSDPKWQQNPRGSKTKKSRDEG